MFDAQRNQSLPRLRRTCPFAPYGSARFRALMLNCLILCLVNSPNILCLLRRNGWWLQRLTAHFVGGADTGTTVHHAILPRLALQVVPLPVGNEPSCRKAGCLMTACDWTLGGGKQVERSAGQQSADQLTPARGKRLEGILLASRTLHLPGGLRSPFLGGTRRGSENGKEAGHALD